MSAPEPLGDEIRDLVDAYCSGLIDDEGVRRLESLLAASEDARREFVAYFHMHTELQFSIRARHAAEAALGRMAAVGGATGSPTALNAVGQVGERFRGIRRLRWWSLAAGILLAAFGFVAGHRGWLSGGRAPQGPSSAAAVNIAWLINAQDCLWDGDEDDMPGREMRPGKVLRLRRGLAEIEFDRGARVILQGPARLELLSGNEARLLRGALTARVPHTARGFTVLSPRGKVVDLGTEFGLSVDERGATALHVFDGKVEASSAGRQDAVVTLLENQGAKIDGRAVAVQAAGRDPAAGRFVRAIVPPPVIVPRERKLDFSGPIAGTQLDAEGRGIGLTHRLPGTGEDLDARDANLRLVPARKALELTTTRSDINQQVGMETGEYLGFRLSDLGFTAQEDFAISATIPGIPGLEAVGQFGLYAGVGSDRNIRGGLISMGPDNYRAFLVNDENGRDRDLYDVGLVRTGEDLRLTLRRTAGKYSLVVENLTTQSSSTLSIAHPEFLDGQPDLYVGLFGANTQSNVRKTLTIKEVAATVWAVSPATSTKMDQPANGRRDIEKRGTGAD